MSILIRAIGTAAIASAAVLSYPPPGVAADSPAPVSAPVVAPVAAPVAAPGTEAAAAPAPRETLEQRISDLHASLRITPGEETKWNGVTKSMRDGAAAMRRLVDRHQAADGTVKSAVAELRAYERVAQAHAANLRSLTASFATLYAAMPDAQKKVADQVFSGFVHHGDASHG